MTLHITLNVQKKIAMKNMFRKQVIDYHKELLTLMARIKTLAYLSWEAIIIRKNFTEK